METSLVLAGHPKKRRLSLLPLPHADHIQGALVLFFDRLLPELLVLQMMCILDRCEG
jgi:hypothetical protein